MANPTATISQPSAWIYGFSVLYVSYLGLVMVQAIYRLTWHPLAKFPGPKLRAAFYLPDLISNFVGAQTDDVAILHERYGSVVRITPGALSFSSPQAWKDIYGLRDGRREIARDYEWHLDHAGKENLIVAHTADHRRMRRIISAAFTPAALIDQQELLQRYFATLIERLRSMSTDSPDTPIDLVKWYNFTTFDIIGDLCLGESFGTLERGEYHHWIAQIFQGLRFVPIIRLAQRFTAVKLLLDGLMLLLPSMAKAQKAHHDFTLGKVERRIALGTDRPDFLTHIIRNNDRREMSFQEIHGTCSVLIMAGSETTASFLSGATYHILANPAIHESLLAEVRTVSADGKIDLASAKDFPYLDRCIKEALRVYPPTPSNLPRRTRNEGDIIDGNFVPGNTSVGVQHWTASHSPLNFNAPDVFDPDRWLDPPPARFEHDRRDASQPFSLGPRSCLGKSLAWFEMRAVMVAMFWHFDMELCAESAAWADGQRTFILWERPALNVRLRSRHR